ncbi:polysaccharide deacetylase [Paenibacillus sp. A14]|uniref:polysaccharide deacetylase n=1 Tax=Paenibacillus sp. A14 TaxID=3119820 RepID=UPI002FE258E9
MRRMWSTRFKTIRGAVLATVLFTAAVWTFGEREAGLAPGSAQPLAQAAQQMPRKSHEVRERESAVKPLLSHGKEKEKDGAAGADIVLANGAGKKEKVVYLTFDDGPSKLTDEVLRILAEERVTATFFVLGKQAERSPEVIHRIAEAGHALGNHTYNHEYGELYKSFPEFWEQIKRTEEVLREITGERPEMVRAPGGTYGHFDKTYFNLLKLGGYKVFDWNVDSGDSKRRNVPASEILSNIKSAKLQNEMIVLLHDGPGHKESVKALPDIIRFYKKHGYIFRALTPEQEPVQFTLADASKTRKKSAPSRSWIETHVTPNAELFAPGRPLLVEAGGVGIRLDAGEYELKEGQYIVPLRATMERLGAEVSWNERTRSAVIRWGDVTLRVNAKADTLARDGVGVAGKPLVYETRFSPKNGSLWVSLKPLLELTGHPIASVSMRETSVRVKAM